MLIVYIAIIVIVPILSQCIRFAIEANVKPQGFVSVIPGLFSLTYSETVSYTHLTLPTKA